MYANIRSYYEYQELIHTKKVVPHLPLGSLIANAPTCSPLISFTLKQNNKISIEKRKALAGGEKGLVRQKKDYLIRNYKK